MARRFAVEDLTPALGSEVSGLDLRSPLPDDLLAELRPLWLDRKVLCFRDQQLTPDQQLAFTRQFGELDKYPFLEGIPGCPLIAQVLKLPHERVNFGGVWHSDTTYLPEPAAGATLYAIELPPVGGDTIFCDMERAWAALPEALKRQVAGLKAVNSSAKPTVAATRQARLGGEAAASRARQWTSVHPVVRHHPETGRPALYVNPAHTLRFEDWNEADSAPLLAQLFAQATQAEFQCRIRWRPGTLLLWDNRSTQHYPVNDYHGHRRLLHRISLKGDRPR